MGLLSLDYLFVNEKYVSGSSSWLSAYDKENLLIDSRCPDVNSEEQEWSRPQLQKKLDW